MEKLHRPAFHDKMEAIDFVRNQGGNEEMKVYISADIEGVTDVTNWERNCIMMPMLQLQRR